MVLEKDTVIYPSLVLVQTRKTRPCLTKRLLMGRKESNQTKSTEDKNHAKFTSSICKEFFYILQYRNDRNLFFNDQNI